MSISTGLKIFPLKKYRNNTNLSAATLKTGKMNTKSEQPLMKENVNKTDWDK